MNETQSAISAKREANGSMPRGLGGLISLINAIERVGNKLPHPFWLFWIMAVILGVISWALAGTSAHLPNSDDNVVVKNLFSLDGLHFALSSAVDNFGEFPPLAIVLVVLLGVAVAEKSGAMEALLRLTIIRLPKRWVTFAIAFAGMMAHIMGDAAYLVMIPLGVLAFRAAGRSPVLGVMVAYVSVSAGFNASPFITPSDAIRSSLATAAARTVDPSALITPAATYLFSGVSSLLLAIVITLVVELVIAKRADLQPSAVDLDTDANVTIHLERREVRGLVWALSTAVVLIAAAGGLLVIPNSPFIKPGQSIVQSEVFSNIAVIIAIVFTGVGIAYGFVTKNFRSPGDVPQAMGEGVAKVAPVLVLFFAVSQFLAYFKWTGLGPILAVRGSDMLNRINAPHVIVLVVIIITIAFINLIVTSGSAMWAIFAPILVPMMMYYGMRPESAMVSFMIGDSVTNAVTPMSAYFVLALSYVNRYRKDAGIGTLMAFTIPVSIAIWVVWSLFFVVWYLLGIPLGPGAPVR